VITRRLTALGVALVATLVSATTFVAAGSATSDRAVPQLVFPIVGQATYHDDFGDPRGQGKHEGNDMMAAWRSPAVAAEAGKIKFWTKSARAGCMLYLYGKSGTTYLYIHLNNDLTEASEDKGGCKLGVSFAVEDGAKVTAGQQIAYVGDSGDAEGNHHLHFEVHPNDGAAVNPFPYLNAGERLLFPARLGAQFSLGLRGTPVAAGAGALELAATSVRWWPGGQWTPVVGTRSVKVSLGPSAVVDSTLVDALSRPELRALQAKAAPAATVTAFTRQARATPEALRGVDGALVVARITRPGGTAVAVGPADPAELVPVDDETDAPPPGVDDRRSGI
jgi:hypothetical protein